MAMIRPETEMKDSGVEWIGDIPSNWETTPLKKIVVDRAGGAWGNEPYENNSTICMRIADFDFDRGVFQDKSETELTKRSYKEYQIDKLLLQTNDICIEKSGGGEKTPVGRAVLFDKPYDALFANFMDRIRVDNAVSFPKYVEYYLRAMYFLSVTTLYIKQTTGIQNLNVTSLLEKEVITLPSLSEQQAIADYLDETCSKIDEIIAEAKASIDEYEKLRQATIDENILGYDSVHIKLRQLGSLKNGLNFSHSDDVANIKFLGVGCFKDNMILSEVADFADEHVDFEILEEYLLSNGDIVFVRSNGSKELVGRSIMVENIDYPVTFSGFCIRFRNMHTELVDNRFLLYYFRTTHFKQSLLKYSNDSTNINNLNQEMLNAIRINAPVIDEQKLIVKKLEEQVLVIDSLISEKESLINDLEAYKKSLIYEVVTGKRRVV